MSRNGESEVTITLTAAEWRKLVSCAFKGRGSSMINGILEKIAEETGKDEPCSHLWENRWGFNGPFMVCAKCGEWHHD